MTKYALGYGLDIYKLAFECIGTSMSDIVQIVLDHLNAAVKERFPGEEIGEIITTPKVLVMIGKVGVVF